MAEDVSRSVLLAHSRAMDVSAATAEIRGPKAASKLRALRGLRLLESHVASACSGTLRGAPLLAQKLHGYVVTTPGRARRFSVRPALVLCAAPASLWIAQQTADGFARRPFLDSDFVVEDLEEFALVVANALERHLYQLRSRTAEYEAAARRAAAILRARGHGPMPPVCRRGSRIRAEPLR